MFVPWGSEGPVQRTFSLSGFLCPIPGQGVRPTPGVGRQGGGRGEGGLLAIVTSTTRRRRAGAGSTWGQADPRERSKPFPGTWALGAWDERGRVLTV